jgi:hypothetical protein
MSAALAQRAGVAQPAARGSLSAISTIAVSPVFSKGALKIVAETLAGPVVMARSAKGSPSLETTSGHT